MTTTTSHRLSAIVFALIAFGNVPGPLAQAASASTHAKVFADIKMSVDLPQDWKIEDEGQDTVCTPPAGDARVMIVALGNPGDDSQFSVIGNAFDSELAQLGATKIHWQAEEKVNKGGMIGIGKKGTAEMDGKATDLMLMVVARSNKGAIVFGAFPHDKPAYRPVITAIFDSVKQVK